MKIKGKKLSGPYVVTVVLPREEGNIVFKAQAVLDFEEFEQLCPRPMAPEIVRPGNVRSRDTTDKIYQKKLTEWSENQVHWMVIQSLKATPELEWETLKDNDPSTWSNYQQEMKEAGISIAEQARIIDAVMTASGLNQDKIDEATKAFLAMEQKLRESASFQEVGAAST